MKRKNGGVMMSKGMMSGKKSVWGVAAVLAAMMVGWMGADEARGDGHVPPRFSMPGTDRKVGFPTGIYDEEADGWQQVREGIARAKADNRRVLVMWGENQCGFCAYLSDLLWHENPGIRSLMDNEYEVVKIDISKTHTKHNDLARRYGATQNVSMEDAPRLTVIDPTSDQGVGTLGGKELVAKPMTMVRVFDENAVLNFLENNKPPMKPATDVIDAALKKAVVEEKGVLAVFVQSAGVCEECGKWVEWIEDAQAMGVIGEGLVVARVNPNRMSAGQSLMERLSGKRPVSAPVVVGLTDRGMKTEPPMVIEKFPKTAAEIDAAVAELVRVAGKKGTSEWREKMRESLKRIAEGGNENKTMQSEQNKEEMKEPSKK